MKTLDEALARVAELEALLDNYRGTCQECGRTGVLLQYESEYEGDYDGGHARLVEECLQDTDECQRLAAIRKEELARIYRENRAKYSSQMAEEFKALYGRALLNNAGGFLGGANGLFAARGTMEWRKSQV